MVPEAKSCEFCGAPFRRETLTLKSWRQKRYCSRTCAVTAWKASNNADIRGGRNGGTARAAALSDAKPSVAFVSILAGRTYEAFEMKHVEV